MPRHQSPEASAVQLAVMDFFRVPTLIILKNLRIKSLGPLSSYRKLPAYVDMLRELQAHWKEQMLALPDTAELRQTISYGFSVSVMKLVHLVADEKVDPRNLIAAARLLAQIDGRFMSQSDAGKTPADADTETVAQELLTALKRHKESVQ